MKICEIEGCENKHRAKGLCCKHYTRLYRTGTTEKPERLCEIEGCESKYLAKGMCSKHYYRMRDYGTTEAQYPEICGVEGCDKPHRAKGMCANHYQRGYDLANPEGKRQYNNTWKARNPDKVKANSHKRRARLNEAPTSPHLDFDITILEFFQDKCMKCGSTGRLEIDHIIPVSKGGSNELSNFQRLCRSCNASKHANYADYRPTWMRV